MLVKDGKINVESKEQFIYNVFAPDNNNDFKPSKFLNTSGSFYGLKKSASGRKHRFHESSRGKLTLKPRSESRDMKISQELSKLHEKNIWVRELYKARMEEEKYIKRRKEHESRLRSQRSSRKRFTSSPFLQNQAVSLEKLEDGPTLNRTSSLMRSDSLVRDGRSSRGVLRSGSKKSSAAYFHNSSIRDKMDSTGRTHNSSMREPLSNVNFSEILDKVNRGRPDLQDSVLKINRDFSFKPSLTAEEKSEIHELEQKYGMVLEDSPSNYQQYDIKSHHDIHYSEALDHSHTRNYPSDYDDVGVSSSLSHTSYHRGSDHTLRSMLDNTSTTERLNQSQHLNGSIRMDDSSANTSFTTVAMDTHHHKKPQISSKSSAGPRSVRMRRKFSRESQKKTYGGSSNSVSSKPKYMSQGKIFDNLSIAAPKGNPPRSLSRGAGRRGNSSALGRYTPVGYNNRASQL
mmetsp:Transcript_10123/g.11046  ORF Transcript_10123/g.11046 Transcript_10123/m.11046 type:complete len:458 (-) Transcript_10123:140-1513(-)